MRNAFLLILSQLIFFSLSANSQKVTIASGSWNDASIWDGAVLPNVTDDVEIHHNVFIPNSNTVTVEAVSVEATGELHLYTNSKIEIQGNLGPYGLENHGLVTNKGIIEIRNCKSGIINTEFFINKYHGTIDIVGPTSLNFTQGIYNNNIPSNDKFQNYGIINLTTLHTGIENTNSTFTNFKAGRLFIVDCKIGLSNRGTFYNSGLFDSFDNDFGAVQNRGFFRNAVPGNVILDEGEYVHFDAGSITRNYGNFDIVNATSFAIDLNDGSFINQAAGSINLNSNSGAMVLDPNAIFNNYGNLSMFDNEPNGYHAFQYYGLFINEHCGEISTNNIFDDLPNAETLVNYGSIISENDQSFSVCNAMENYGVIDNDGDLSNIIQNGIQVRTIEEQLIENVIISNAIGLGDLSNHVIEGWYIDENSTTEGAIYDAISNELTVTADGAGLNALWVRITDGVSNCTEDFEVVFTISNGSNPTGYKYDHDLVDAKAVLDSNEAEASKIAEIYLFDLSGKFIGKVNTRVELNQFLESLTPSIYIMRVLFSNGENKTSKIFSQALGAH